MEEVQLNNKRGGKRGRLGERWNEVGKGLWGKPTSWAGPLDNSYVPA